jgi:DNA-directed RNA polymerase subunit H (RpoH/RPB5)
MADETKEPTFEEMKAELVKTQTLLNQMKEKRVLENFEIAMLDLRRSGSAKTVIDSVEAVYNLMAVEYNQKYFPQAAPGAMARRAGKQKPKPPEEKPDETKTEEAKPEDTNPEDANPEEGSETS